MACILERGIVRKRKNAVSVWIRVRRIGQSDETDYEVGFLSVSGSCEIVLVNGFAAAAAAAGVAGIDTVFEDAACNSSSWGGNYCCCSHRPHHHAGSVHVGSNLALGP